MEQNNLEYFIFLNLVKYYTINRFYKTIPIITNKKDTRKTVLGHSKKIVDGKALSKKASGGLFLSLHEQK